MSLKDQLIGAWSLVSLETTEKDGKVTQPLGPNPKGTLMYSASGRMAAVLVHPDRPRFVATDSRQATDAEVVQAFKGCVAYFGTFEIRDEAKGIVVHKVEGSLFPNWAGTDQVRYAKLDGDRLVIQNPTTAFGRSGAVARLVWQRTK